MPERHEVLVVEVTVVSSVGYIVRSAARSKCGVDGRPAKGCGWTTSHLLAPDHARFITGQKLDVDGGYRI